MKQELGHLTNQNKKKKTQGIVPVLYGEKLKQVIHCTGGQVCNQLEIYTLHRCIVRGFTMYCLWMQMRNLSKAHFSRKQKQGGRSTTSPQISSREKISEEIPLHKQWGGKGGWRFQCKCQKCFFWPTEHIKEWAAQQYIIKWVRQKIANLLVWVSRQN